MTEQEYQLAVMDDDGYGCAPTTSPGEREGYTEIAVGGGVWRVVPGSIAEGMARYAARQLEAAA